MGRLLRFSERTFEWKIQRSRGRLQQLQRNFRNDSQGDSLDVASSAVGPRCSTRSAAQLSPRARRRWAKWAKWTRPPFWRKIWQGNLEGTNVTWKAPSQLASEVSLVVSLCMLCHICHTYVLYICQHGLLLRHGEIRRLQPVKQIFCVLQVLSTAGQRRRAKERPLNPWTKVAGNHVMSLSRMLDNWNGKSFQPWSHAQLPSKNMLAQPLSGSAAPSVSCDNIVTTCWFVTGGHIIKYLAASPHLVPVLSAIFWSPPWCW